MKSTMRYLLATLLLLTGCASTQIMPQSHTDMIKEIMAKTKAANVLIYPATSSKVNDSKHFSTGSGSGILIDSNGLIITNQHVTDSAKEVSVEMPNRKIFIGKIIGSDPDLDISVIKIELINTPYLKFSDSNDLESGDQVISTGNPSHFQGITTIGFIGNLHSTLGGISSSESYIQHTAMIFPGNSGGSLVNMKGELIGMNTAIYEGVTSLNFAIPSHTLMKVIPILIAKGHFDHAWIGIMAQGLNTDLSEKFNTCEGCGVLISEIEPNSPSEKNKLQVGDIITRINKRNVHDILDITSTIGSMLPGETIVMDFTHNGIKNSKIIILEKRPENKAEIIPEAKKEEGNEDSESN